MTSVEAMLRLAGEVGQLSFGPPVTCVYNPLDYAWEAHRAYLERYGRGQREILLLGMNPGPWGMMQTGVPFGEVGAVRDWLGIDAHVAQPAHVHPKRPVTGMACRRSEVSGARLWGWARDAWGTPTRFFARFFVLNYCPLVLLEESGRNRTPNRLAAGERRALEEVCDRALSDTVAYFRPRWVVGIGAFASACAERVVGDRAKVGRLLHPSPASPLANKGWAQQATAQLQGMGIRVGD